MIPAAVVVVATLVGVVVTMRAGEGSSPPQPRVFAPSTTTPTRHPHPTTSTTSTTVVPIPVAPLVTPAVPGEGVWSPAGQRTTERPPLFVTSLRPPGGGEPAGVARIDMTLTKVVVFAGTTQPGGTWAAMGAVPASWQPAMVAAFNGGFQFNSAGGGFYSDGRVGLPLRDGAASLVVRKDGTAEVDLWGRDATLTADVAQVRQNLDLLVDNRHPTALAETPGAWGATFSHVAATWRSAVGSDSRRHLYFVGGPGLTPAALAAILVASGAERGMEFDINPQWVFCAYYGGHPWAGYKLIPSMNYGPAHVLTTNWRDFVAVFTRPTW